MRKPELGSKMRLGFVALGILVVVEGIEYIVGVTVKKGNWPYLVALAVPGAGLILYYFMHIRQLWHPEE